MAEFRKAVEAAPQSVEAYVYLGLGLVQAKRNGEAITVLQEAAKLDAKQANDIVTRALQLPPSDANLETLIRSIGGP